MLKIFLLFDIININSEIIQQDVFGEGLVVPSLGFYGKWQIKYHLRCLIKIKLLLVCDKDDHTRIQWYYQSESSNRGMGDRNFS